MIELFNVLLHLYQNYMDSGHKRLIKFEKWLLQNLLYSEIQPSKDIINHHFTTENIQIDKLSTNTFRIYSTQEIHKLNTKCRGYLLRLELENVISPSTREKIIHEALGINKFLELNDIEYLTKDILIEEFGNSQDKIYSNKIVDESQNQILH